MMKRLLTSAIFLLVTLASASAAMAAEIYWELDSDVVQLGPYLETWEDPSLEAGVNEAIVAWRAGEFSKLNDAIPNLGLSSNAHWIRFSIVNKSDREQHLLFVLRNPMINRLDTYLVEGDRAHFVKRSGLHYRHMNESIFHSQFSIEIDLKPNQRVQVYQRLVSTSLLILDADVGIVQKVFEKSWKLVLEHGLILGILNFLILYNFVVSMLLRSRSYLWAALLSLMFACYQVSLSGLGPQLFVPQLGWWWERAPILFSGCTMLAGTLFSRSFLELWVHCKSCNRAAIVHAGITILAILVTLFSPLYGNWMMVGLLVFAVVLLVWAPIHSWKNGKDGAVIFLVAWSVFIFACFLYVLTLFGVQWFGRAGVYALAIGYVISGLLFSVALSERVRRLQRAYEETLEETVQERTNELYDTISNLNREISERRAAEQQLRESELRFRTVFHTTPEAIALSRLSDGQYIDVNYSFCRLTEFSRQELVGHSSIETNLWSDAQSRDVWSRQLKEKRQIVNFEIQFHTKNGQKREALISAQVVSLYGEPHVISILRDVTEMKQREHERRLLLKQMHETQRLESLVQMAGGIAHEFNNLLTGIMGNASLLKDDARPDTELYEQLGQIEEAVKRASVLSHQMLDFSGKGNFVMKAIDMNAVIASTEDTISSRQPPNCEIIYELGEDLEAVDGDEGQLQQAIINLVLNAGESLQGDQGKITVSSYKLATQNWRRFAPQVGDLLIGRKYVIVEVKDNGSGIAPEILKNMFDPFFSTKFPGRGLGLAVVQGIIRGHRGAVSVTSAEGEGTSVRLAIPTLEAYAKGENQLAGYSETPMKTDKQLKTILVVDDETSVRRFLNRSLAHGGYETVEAESGEIGIALLSERVNDIDVVILDMTLPDFEGDEVFRRMREIRDDLPILVVSGYSRPEFLDEGESLCDFIQKPFKTKVLTECLISLFNGNG